MVLKNSQPNRTVICILTGHSDFALMSMSINGFPFSFNCTLPQLNSYCVGLQLCHASSVSDTVGGNIGTGCYLKCLVSLKRYFTILTLSVINQLHNAQIILIILQLCECTFYFYAQNLVLEIYVKYRL